MTIRALTCDTFGTLVDWRGSILAELEALGALPRRMEELLSRGDGQGQRRGVAVDHRGCDCHRRLVELLDTYDIGGMSEAGVDHLNRVWWRVASNAVTAEASRD